MQKQGGPGRAARRAHIAATPGKAASATRPPPASALLPSANSMNAASLRATNLGETGVGLVGVQDELIQEIQGVQDEFAWSQGVQPRCSGGSGEPPEPPTCFSLAVDLPGGGDRLAVDRAAAPDAGHRDVHGAQRRRRLRERPVHLSFLGSHGP